MTSQTSKSVKQQMIDRARERYGGLQLKQYHIQNQVLGVGSFGAAMVCNKYKVIKISDFENSKHKSAQRVFEREIQIYQELYKYRDVTPFLVQLYARIEFEDREGAICHGVIMEYGGLNLEQYLQHKRWLVFPMFQLLKIGLQITQGLQAMHEAGYIHRDIKPGNITLNSKTHSIKLIDLGLARQYSPKVQPCRIKKCIGTPRFCAARQHFGFAGSPACDLEAMFYSLLFLAGEQLPWHGYKSSNPKTRIRRIGQMKENASSECLCTKLPKGGSKLFEEIRRLRYSDQPDYEKILEYFKTQPTQQQTQSECPANLNSKKRKIPNLKTKTKEEEEEDLKQKKTRSPLSHT